MPRCHYHAIDQTHTFAKGNLTLSKWFCHSLRPLRVDLAVIRLQVKGLVLPVPPGKEGKGKGNGSGNRGVAPSSLEYQAQSSQCTLEVPNHLFVETYLVACVVCRASRPPLFSLAQHIRVGTYLLCTLRSC